MTAAEILALEGRQLDAAIAEALGWLVVACDDGEDWYERQVTRFPCLVQHSQGGQWMYLEDRGADYLDNAWWPSDDLATAFADIDAALRSRGLYLSLHSAPGGYWCRVWILTKAHVITPSCDSPATALCRAFLLGTPGQSASTLQPFAGQ